MRSNVSHVCLINFRWSYHGPITSPELVRRGHRQILDGDFDRCAGFSSCFALHVAFRQVELGYTATDVPAIDRLVGFRAAFHLAEIEIEYANSATTAIMIQFMNYGN